MQNQQMQNDDVRVFKGDAELTDAKWWCTGVHECEVIVMLSYEALDAVVSS